MTANPKLAAIEKKIANAEKSVQDAKAEFATLAPEDLEPLMLSDEVAVYFHCTRQHLYNMVRKGSIPFIKFGAEIRFRRSDVVSFGVQK